jgi:hypothetical protein
MLLLHQFGSLSRMMRMFVALGYALPANTSSTLGSIMGSSGGSGGTSRDEKRKRKQSSSAASSSTGSTGSAAVVTGANALLRQILKVSTTLLLVTPPIILSHNRHHSSSSIVSEKELAKLLHTTIVPMCHDVRPKVRKAAWGCGMEIIVVASSASSSTSMDDGTEKKDTGRMMQRKVVADFLWEYCHAVLSNYTPSSSLSSSSSGSKDTTSLKVIHVLRFLSGALSYADDERIRIRFGDCCLTMLASGGGGGGGGGGRGRVGGKDSMAGKSAVVSSEVGKETLATLLSCLEMTEHEQELHNDDDDGDNKSSQQFVGAASTDPNEGMSKFAAKVLTFLLQHRPNDSNSSNERQDYMHAMYGRCMLACMERMMSLTTSFDIGMESDIVPTPTLLAMKLFPSVLSSMLHLCEGSSTVGRSTNEGEMGNIHSDTSCGSEFNQLVSRMMPKILSFLGREEQTNATLHRVSLEILPQCVPVIRQTLQLKYRSAWGSILPGGYSTFTSSVARFLLELRTSSESTGGIGRKDIAELDDELSSWVQTLVLSLLRLHDDVSNGDGTARTAVEYATTTIIRDIGVELFLSMVDFLNDDDSGGLHKQTLSSSKSSIRDDRAWLLPLMKQSTDSLRRSTTSDDCITRKTHLSFFQGNVLSLARKCDAATADGHRTAAEISIQKSRVLELWSLFPSFCVYPVDMKENFESVAKTVLKAIGDYVRYPALIVRACAMMNVFCSIDL